ncbi:PLP-dependent aminotransferase family protein [Neobacillus sp.]|uniref:MocR-like pyridoxine biosynthesis transcription factor PdxR n=1 Tax=Neobacillus sp. TaxID=2675273 RepID=UPI00289DCABA|nr:PLP-dependent aminotransferase family protein [Neobacillus sp.]
MYEFTFQFDLENTTTKYQQLYQYIKTEISNGYLAAGTKLPSTRNLCAHLGISRNTVDTAYGQLLAEGYLVSKEKSGYYVSEDMRTHLFTPHEVNSTLLTSAESNKNDDHSALLYDFRYGQIDQTNFPYSVWKKAVTQWLASSKSTGLSYGHRQGESSLRQEIASYIRNARGVKCTPEQIILTSGTQMSLDLICKLLKCVHHSVAIEDPGYIGARTIFRTNGYEMVPIALDSAGINLHQLRDSSVRLTLVTPSHQFPSGMIMPISRRLELLKWADENDGIIIENDYEGEFSYIGNPIPSLQSHDENGRVIYLYNFSSSLLPSVRTSFLVLPPALFVKYQELFASLEQTVPIIEQKAIEYFIAEGAWEKHIRKMKNIYSKKFVILTEAIRKHMNDRVEIIGNKAGLHILLRVKTHNTEENLIENAKRAGIRVYPTTQYWLGNPSGEYPLILLGFGGMDVSEFDEAIHLLSNVWFK